MFDTIEVNGEEFLVFLDVENMRLYVKQSLEKQLCTEEKKKQIIIMKDNVVCIDTNYKYMGNYYNVFYYFNFRVLDYIDGIKEISKIQYFSKIVDNFLVPHVEAGERIKEDKKTIELEFCEKKLEININRKNYIDEYNKDFYKKSYIECEFEATNDWEYIYNLCVVIEKYLKVSLYTKSIDIPTIKVFNSNNIEIGQLVINKSFYEKPDFILLNGKYEGVIEKNTKKILEFLCKNDINFSNIRNYDSDYTERFDTKRIYNLYSAFEVECNNIYIKKEKNETYENIKEKVIAFSQNLAEYKNEKEFIDGLVNDRIKNYGIGYGHREKIKNAIQDFIKIFPNRTGFYCLEEITDKIIKTVYKLRTYIIHDNFVGTLSEEEDRYLQYFEWIVFAMQLKRMNVINEDIEEFLDLTFGVG